jgi:hypothetical protein
LVLALALSGCDHDKTVDQKQQGENGERFAAEEVIRRGPITVGVGIDRDEIKLSDILHFTLWVEVDEAYEIELPALGDKLERFGIRDYQTSDTALTAGGKKRVERTYELEPFLSGTYTIDPMTVRFGKPAKDGTDMDEDATLKHRVQTEPLEVTVTSILPSEVEALEINPIEPMKTPEKQLNQKALLLWGAVSVAIVILLIVLVFVWRARKGSSSTVEKKYSPQELAFRELQELVDDQLVEQGMIKLFYQRLSLVLRNYIERRFGVRAPEQTTEEFLSDLRRNRTLPQNYMEMLEDFQKHCDLVKFAEFQPQAPDIQKAFDSCKAFVGGTGDSEDDNETKEES